MPSIDPDTVFDALQDSLARLRRANTDSKQLLKTNQNLLELVDSFGFAELMLDLETSLGVELPLDQVDLASIVQIDRLIGFVCKHA